MYYRYTNLEILNKTVTPYNFLKNLDILLIRHGESEANALRKKLKEDGELLSEDLKIEDATIKLSSLGKEQSIQLGKRIKKYIDDKNTSEEKILILISPYERARETFEIANEYMKFDKDNENIFVLNSLREQFYGAFHMISREVKQKEYEKIYNECQRNTISYYKPQFLGESPAQVSDRAYNVLNFIQEYVKDRDIEKVFIFGHGNINRCILMNILNLPAEFYDDFEMGDNTSIINIKNGKYNNDF